METVRQANAGDGSTQEEWVEQNNGLYSSGGLRSMEADEHFNLLFSVTMGSIF